MNYIIQNPGKHIFNVGTGIGTSVLDVITTFEKTNKVKVPYSIGARREGDIEKIYADSSFIKNKIGWKAKESLEQAMKSAWKWEQAKKDYDLSE